MSIRPPLTRVHLDSQEALDTAMDLEVVSGMEYQEALFMVAAFQEVLEMARGVEYQEASAMETEYLEVFMEAEFREALAMEVARGMESQEALGP